MSANPPAVSLSFEHRTSSLQSATRYIKKRWCCISQRDLILIFRFQGAEFLDDQVRFIFQWVRIDLKNFDRSQLPPRISWREAYLIAARAQTQALVDANIPPSEWPKSGVYLLHFDPRYKHAGHYLGFAEDIDRRVEQHRAGRSGVKLVTAAAIAGCDMVLASTWIGGDRKLERALKGPPDRRTGSLARLCPICRSEAAR